MGVFLMFQRYYTIINELPYLMYLILNNR